MERICYAERTNVRYKNGIYYRYLYGIANILLCDYYCYSRFWSFCFIAKGWYNNSDKD